MSMNAAAVASTVARWATSAAAPVKARRAAAVNGSSSRRLLPRSARADAAIIDGKAIAEDVREEVRLKVAEMKEKHGKVPGESQREHTSNPTERNRRRTRTRR